MFHKCKVTVVDKKFDKEVIDRYLSQPEYMKICDVVEIGQEFIINSPFDMPEGICPSAWADLKPAIMVMASGGSFKMMKNENMSISICQDPFRPVTFQIERLC